MEKDPAVGDEVRLSREREAIRAVKWKSVEEHTDDLSRKVSETYRIVVLCAYWVIALLRCGPRSLLSVTQLARALTKQHMDSL